MAQMRVVFSPVLHVPLQLVVVLVTWQCLMTEVHGHGYLLEPPGRSSMWRAGFASPINPDDNGLNCGGFQNQYEAEGGRCGICGDPFQGPRKNEAGGVYATGVISRHYTQGQVIGVTVVVTANHRGWFEFKLCPNNNLYKAATQECLDRHVLQNADGTGSRVRIGRRQGHIDLQLRLPADVTCSQCVLQWRWHAGNSYGVDPNGVGCVGCGNQEEFYSCSDVEISASANTVLGSVAHAEPWSLSADNKPVSLSFVPPGDRQKGSVGGQAVGASGVAGSVVAGAFGVRRRCVAISPMWRGDAEMDLWCQNVCQSLHDCPPSFCACS